MRLPFSKLSGAGNDFVLVDAARLPRGVSLPALARRLSLRRAAVGSDGLLVARRRGRSGAPSFDYLNADGSRAFCGNGARCAAWWMHLRGWAGRAFSLGSSRGALPCKVTGKERVRVGMPDAGKLRLGLKLKAAGRSLRVDFVDTGVPHAVARVMDLERFPVLEAGRALRRSPAFAPAGTNVDFVQAKGGMLHVRTYERGVEDETLACGTGVTAVAVLSHFWTGKRPPVRVRAREAVLTVGFTPLADGRFRDVWLEGPARLVYEGEIQI